MATPPQAAGQGSAVLGRVRLGARATLARDAVLRGDGHDIVVGADFHLGAGSTVHISHGQCGTIVGDRVAVGANAVVHACTVQDDVVVEDDAVILDAAVVGAGSIVERGAVVFARAVLAPGQRYAGVPAVVVGPVDAAELAAAQAAVRGRTPHGEPVSTRAVPVATGAGFVAGTVHGPGVIELAEGSSVWFGCRVEGALGRIVVGPAANVQDNSVLRSERVPVVVGAHTTVGHNVVLHDCTVGARVLVGMGSRLAPGTVVEDDVLLAAGSATTEGQRLQANSMWAGRPARRVAELDERKRRMIASAAVVYGEYARGFGMAQPSS